MRLFHRRAPSAPTASPVAAAPPVPAPLEERLAWVERELAAVAGDRSLCDLSASGPTGQVKRLEGAMAALLELRRALRRDLDRPVDVADEAIRRWRAELEAAKGPIWVAYRQGGVDELSRTRDALVGTVVRPPSGQPV